MINTHVSSEVIERLGYQRGSLYVRFMNGTVYRYRKVPFQQYDVLTQAESVGQLFNKSVKGRFDYEKCINDPF